MFWIKPMHRLRDKRQEAVLSVTVLVTAGQAVPAIAKDVTKGVSQGDAHRGLPVPC